jgi:hypothetical protein
MFLRRSMTDLPELVEMVQDQKSESKGEIMMN